MAGEKSSIPAIIVTPSSPTCDFEFYIAFSPKPTLRDRLSNYMAPFTFRARTAIIVSLLFFIVLCHLFTHQFVIIRPHLRFDTFEAGQYADEHIDAQYWGWLGIKSLWNATIADGKRDFIVDASLPA